MTKTSAAALAIVAGLLATSPLFGRLVGNTIHPTVTITEGARTLIVSGPMECTEGERVHVLVTITQRTTGAIAEGRGFKTCSGAPEEWEVEAHSRGEAGFVAAGATAVAVAWTERRGVSTDAHQWLVPVTLIPE